MNRQYVIMAGGYYGHFDRPKALMEVFGETILARTLRFLDVEGIDRKDIHISGTDERLREYGLDILVHQNTYQFTPMMVNGDSEEPCVIEGCWLDAFYPYFPDDIKVTYLYGDVVYTPEALHTIVTCDRPGNILFGTGIARNQLHKNWGEPFAYKVDDYSIFMDGVNAVKDLWKKGEVERNPLTWELYRYLNGLDLNVQAIVDDTYICIDDGTADIDSPWRVKEVENSL